MNMGTLYVSTLNECHARLIRKGFHDFSDREDIIQETWARLLPCEVLTSEQVFAKLWSVSGNLIDRRKRFSETMKRFSETADTTHEGTADTRLLWAKDVLDNDPQLKEDLQSTEPAARVRRFRKIQKLRETV